MLGGWGPGASEGGWPGPPGSQSGGWGAGEGGGRLTQRRWLERHLAGDGGAPSSSWAAGRDPSRLVTNQLFELL